MYRLKEKNGKLFLQRRVLRFFWKDMYNNYINGSSPMTYGKNELDKANREVYGSTADTLPVVYTNNEREL